MLCAVTHIKVKALTDFILLWVFRTVLDFEFCLVHKRNSFCVIIIPSEPLGFGQSFPIAGKNEKTLPKFREKMVLRQQEYVLAIIPRFAPEYLSTALSSISKR